MSNDTDGSISFIQVMSTTSVMTPTSQPSIKRVWPTSLLAQSRLRRAVTSQLGTPGRHVCCHTGVVTRSVQVQINDYLRSLSSVTVPRLFTYASNDEMAAFAAQSWLRDH